MRRYAPVLRLVGVAVFATAAAVALSATTALAATDPTPTPSALPLVTEPPVLAPPADNLVLAPVDDEGFARFAGEVLSDPSVTAVLRDGTGTIIVQRIPTLGGVETLRVDGMLARFSNVIVVDGTEDASASATTDVVGGAGLRFASPSTTDDIEYCSAGFAAWSPDGQPALLSSGHCAIGVTGAELGTVELTTPTGDEAGGGAVDTSTVTISGWLGSLSMHQFGGTENQPGSTAPGQALDISVARVENPDLTVLPAVTDWTTPDDLSASLLGTVTGLGEAAPGDAVARAGRTTGVATGAVRYTGYLVVDGHLVKGFAIDSAARPGDSGGPVVRGTTAVGLISGFFQLDGTDLTWASDLATGLEASGGYTLQRDLAEPVISASGSVRTDEVVSGTAEASATLQFAFLVGGASSADPFAGAQTLTADANGAWSIPAPVEPGSYTLVVRSVDGFNQSATVEATLEVTAVPAPPTTAPPTTAPPVTAPPVSSPPVTAPPAPAGPAATPPAVTVSPTATTAPQPLAPTDASPPLAVWAVAGVLAGVVVLATARRRRAAR